VFQIVRHTVGSIVIVTDKLGSYGAALRIIGSLVNMSKACAPITGQRIRINLFDDVSAKWGASNHLIYKSAHRFVSLHAAVYNAINVQRDLICRPTHRQFLAEAHNVWSDATVAAA
jgi:putative transposase